MYKKTLNDAIIRTTDGAVIPANQSNRDYQDYLAWVATGNTADQAQSLSEVQDAQIAILTMSYNTAIQLPVSYMSTTFQADLYSQDLVTKCLSPGAVPSGFFWLDANNAKVTMTFVQLQGLAAAMLAQGQAAFAKLQTLKAQVRAATTIATVKAVTW